MVVSARANGTTRRGVLATGGTAVGSVLLAGCSTPEVDSGGGEEDSYTVSMEPVGKVQFQDVPEEWVVYESNYAEMGIVLGVGDGLLAAGELNRIVTKHFDELGIEFDLDSLTELWNDGVDRELFYELDPDVHLIDPNWLVHNSAFGLEEADVEEIDENVAPFIGNTIFRRTDDWHDYRYYSMYEAFELVADVFQQRDRFEEFADLHDEFVSDVESRLPPIEDRPTALLTHDNSDEPEEFTPYRLSDRGTDNKHWHELGLEDALSGTGIDGLSTTERGTLDYETVLEVDPDVILIRGHHHKSRDEFRESVLSYMEDHSVGSELTAVQNGRVFQGGPLYLGPISHLFELERGAQQLYTDEFEPDEDLFDRDRVADISTDS
ncbi:ABC transporter substrate-binding protein [Halostagnicola sp. A-GB9-2]|uniref:ABC transporter substrate-binding protein n=1 Tax=Halostagnicola sp. A-GB9-2 TaxID=3048066 RepID=UPI0024BFD22B|nr:ABC transporter substrate-binding protein [Halostagnicola sp. A-GB9-2]MDJ1433925.1 ABC transporter substrate-binding protein [Halostagnicola sp. A-GB9-2]